MITVLSELQQGNKGAQGLQGEDGVTGVAVSTDHDTMCAVSPHSRELLVTLGQRVLLVSQELQSVLITHSILIMLLI